MWFASYHYECFQFLPTQWWTRDVWVIQVLGLHAFVFLFKLNSVENSIIVFPTDSILSLFWMRIPLLVVIAAAFVYCCIRLQYCRRDYGIQRRILEGSLKTRRTHPSYYNWDDGVGWKKKEPWWVDYNRLCRILLKQVNSPKNTYTIINNGIAGGLGHKTRSIIASLTNAIMLGRNYKCSVLSQS